MRLSTNQLAVDTQYVKAVPQQAIMSDRAAKKRLIRERAEALLNRVKSRGEVRIDRYDLAHY